MVLSLDVYAQAPPGAPAHFPAKTPPFPQRSSHPSSRQSLLMLKFLKLNLLKLNLRKLNMLWQTAEAKSAKAELVKGKFAKAKLAKIGIAQAKFAKANCAKAKVTKSKFAADELAKGKCAKLDIQQLIWYAKAQCARVNLNVLKVNNLNLPIQNLI